MSTDRTENYQLHAWGAEDEERLAEINENFAAIDGALKEKAEVVTGSYTGDWTDGRKIELGFTPRMVLVKQSRDCTVGNISTQVSYVPTVAIYGVEGNSMNVSEGGFTVEKHNLTNSANVVYIFAAVR